MATKKKSGGVLLKVIVLLLVIVLLVGAIMFISKLSNNFTDDIKTFYLVVDGEIITSDAMNMSLLDKKIEVHSLSVDKSFTYKIVAKQSRNFTFTVDGVEHAFADKTDYSDSFEVDKSNNSLKIATTNLTSILNNVYKTNVEMPYLNEEVCYFTLVVTSADGKKSISVDFFIDIALADGIYFDKTQILF